MKKCLSKAALALVAIWLGFSFNTICHAAGTWELVMDKDAIKAYVREVPGSDIKEIRAVFTLNATMENIGEVLRDIPANTKWIPYCKVSKLIEMIHRNNLKVYTGMDFPWPVKNRDLVVESNTRYELDAGRAIVNLKSIKDDRHPENDDHVRITEFTGKYILEYIERNKTGLIYTYRVDLSGHIPVYVMNFLGKYTLYDTFQGLREMIKKPKYVEAGKKSPDRTIAEGIMNNRDKARKVFKTRLKEFIKDNGLIAKLVNDKDLLQRFFAAENALAEILLYGWGSRDSHRKAVVEILKAYLPKHVHDEAKVRIILENEALIDMILSGSGSSWDYIQARIKG